MFYSNQSATIHSFMQLSKLHQRAVELKSSGLSHKEIIVRLKKSYKKAPSLNTVNQWFSAEGLLKSAYDEYNAHSGEEALREAGHASKRAIKDAIALVTAIMNDTSLEPRTRLQAAQTILKLLPNQAFVSKEALEPPGRSIEEVLDELEANDVEYSDADKALMAAAFPDDPIVLEQSRGLT